MKHVTSFNLSPEALRRLVSKSISVGTTRSAIVDALCMSYLPEAPVAPAARPSLQQKLWQEA